MVLPDLVELLEDGRTPAGRRALARALAFGAQGGRVSPSAETTR